MRIWPRQRPTLATGRSVGYPSQTGLLSVHRVRRGERLDWAEQESKTAWIQMGNTAELTSLDAAGCAIDSTSMEYRERGLDAVFVSTMPCKISYYIKWSPKLH